jgi:hypothetical protein
MIRAKWLLAALALPLTISTAFAAINPDKLPQVPCSDLKLGVAFFAYFGIASCWLIVWFFL